MLVNVINKTVEEKEVTSISINAKCSDNFSGSFKDKNGNTVFTIENEYVPKFFPGNHYGDYIILDIELETGKILNWKKPIQSDIEAIINQNWVY